MLKSEKYCSTDVKAAYVVIRTVFIEIKNDNVLQTSTHTVFLCQMVEKKVGERSKSKQMKCNKTQHTNHNTDE